MKTRMLPVNPYISKIVFIILRSHLNGAQIKTHMFPVKTLYLKQIHILHKQGIGYEREDFIQ